jgi:hypothetical protein
MKNLFASLILLLVIQSAGISQSFDLQKLLKENKFVTTNAKVIPLTDGNKSGISMTGMAWIKDKKFSTGVIEVDLRGKDIFQQSFLGIAFHGVDSITYDLVYFRPFNYRAEDPIRKIHAVQYVSQPDWDWKRLRDERNGVYEKAIDPAPAATDWVHARIEVGDKQIKVFVNGAKIPSLVVDKLNDRKDGMIGLWNEGENGDFANLVIK